MGQKTCPRCKAFRYLRNGLCVKCTTDLRYLAEGPPQKKLHKLAKQGPCRESPDDGIPKEQKPLFWLYLEHYLDKMSHMPQQQRRGLAIAVARNKILHPRNAATARHMKITGLVFKNKKARYRKALERLDCIQRGVPFPPPIPRPQRRKDYIPPPRTKYLDIG